MLYPASSREGQFPDHRDDELLITIESLRCELMEVARERSLTDRTVVELSERLDSYIVMAQNRKLERLRSRKAEAEAAAPPLKNSRGPKRSLLRQ